MDSQPRSVRRQRQIGDRLRDLIVAPEFGRKLGRLVVARYEAATRRVSKSTLLLIGILLVHTGDGIVAEANGRED